MTNGTRAPVRSSAAPQISNDTGQWLTLRRAKVLHAHGIRTLADLSVCIPRQRRWWAQSTGRA
ncbi:phage integrase family protein [Paraburkholderia sediminicola]|uniref:phage integrase family protein n=1 Tax=Paraburkholderia sediminicola TaxID=458836 RepID=UPI0038BB786F